MDSNKIFAFPCVSRAGDYELKAKLMSEENITRIIKSVADTPSYVINDDLNNLKFVIDGYYFELIDFPLNGDQYAYIYTKETSTGKLLEGDYGTDLKGLIITNQIPTDKNYLTLCTSGIIPNSSRAKFTQKSLAITNIDCGELN